MEASSLLRALVVALSLSSQLCSCSVRSCKDSSTTFFSLPNFNMASSCFARSSFNVSICLSRDAFSVSNCDQEEGEIFVMNLLLISDTFLWRTASNSGQPPCGRNFYGLIAVCYRSDNYHFINHLCAYQNYNNILKLFFIQVRVYRAKKVCPHTWTET